MPTGGYPSTQFLQVAPAREADAVDQTARSMTRSARRRDRGRHVAALALDRAHASRWPSHAGSHESQSWSVQPAGRHREPGRATDWRGVRVMTDVACFCDCLYSFEGAAGACPRCGAVAAIVTGATPTGYERSRRAQQPMPARGGNAEGAVPE